MNMGPLAGMKCITPLILVISLHGHLSELPLLHMISMIELKSTFTCDYGICTILYRLEKYISNVLLYIQSCIKPLIGQ